MIETKNFPKAYVETIEILKLLERSEYRKIDNKFIDMLNTKKDNNYTYTLDGKNIEQENIMKETRVILAYIFMNYLGTDEEKNIINKKFQSDIEKSEQLKSEKYSVDVFQNTKQKQNKNVNTQLIVYPKQTFIRKLLNKIKGLLNIK